MSDKPSDWLTTVISDKLTVVQAGIFLDDKRKADKESSPMDLFLGFEAAGSRQFRGSSDGESLVIDTEELKEVDMGQLGRVEVRDLSSVAPWQNCMDQRLIEYRKVLTRRALLAGFGMVFENRAQVWVINSGDELMVFPNAPENLLEGSDLIVKVGD